MILLQREDLSAETSSLLGDYQSAIDASVDYATKVTEAKRLFKLRNNRQNPAFNEVRNVLSRLSGAAGRCTYCEVSVPDEVEHFCLRHYIQRRLLRGATFYMHAVPATVRRVRDLPSRLKGDVLTLPGERMRILFPLWKGRLF